MEVFHSNPPLASNEPIICDLDLIILQYSQEQKIIQFIGTCITFVNSARITLQLKLTQVLANQTFKDR